MTNGGLFINFQMFVILIAEPLREMGTVYP